MCWGGVVCYFLRISLFPSHRTFLFQPKSKLTLLQQKRNHSRPFAQRSMCVRLTERKKERKKERKIERDTLSQKGPKKCRAILACLSESTNFLWFAAWEEKRATQNWKYLVSFPTGANQKRRERKHSVERKEKENRKKQLTCLATAWRRTGLPIGLAGSWLGLWKESLCFFNCAWRERESVSVCSSVCLFVCDSLLSNLTVFCCQAAFNFVALFLLQLSCSELFFFFFPLFLVSKAFVEGSRVALTFLVSKINRSFLHWNLPDDSSYILSVRPVAPSPWLVFFLY